jgi:hypothetical protein
MREIFLHHRELFDSCISKTLHDLSEQSLRGFNAVNYLWCGHLIYLMEKDNNE